MIVTADMIKLVLSSTQLQKVSVTLWFHQLQCLVLCSVFIDLRSAQCACLSNGLCVGSETNKLNSIKSKQWLTPKISEGGGKVSSQCVTSQINFRGSAEGTTIIGGSGGMPPRKVCKITPKSTRFCAFWKQVLV